MIKTAVVLCVVFTALVHYKPAMSAVDPDIHEYHSSKVLAGKINSTGSDTMANLLFFWSEGFKQNHPEVIAEVYAEGSSTAPTALIDKTANIAPMSRKMKPQEYNAFVNKYGYPPTEIKVALDALAVFVNADNKLQELTLKQVDSIFSSSFLCSNSASLVKWEHIEAPLPDQKINLYGRNSASGSSEFFRQQALCEGTFKRTISELPGSASVVQAISNDINAIGFSGLGYKTAGVKTVPLRLNDGSKIIASVEQIVSGKYPLSRYLYVYVNKHPEKPLPDLEKSFIHFMLSQSGQRTVELDGYISLSKKQIEQELNKIR